jgi:O-antigen/teichoic acid export membrane protein
LSATVDAFLFWYAAVGICQSLIFGAVLWRALPMQKRPPVFRAYELRNSSRFAAGLFAISALSIVLNQLDRIILSSMRPLEELGYFTLAMSVAAGFGRMVLPMFNAVYPRYSRLVATNESQALADLYHLSSQCLAVVVASISVVLIAYSKAILWLWTGDSIIAEKVAPTLAVLVTGSALNGLLNMPYALQLAHGWTWLGVIANCVALLICVPLGFLLVDRYGMIGAAFLLPAINLGFLAVCLPITHHRLLRHETMRSYLRDILPPFFAAIAVGLPFAASSHFVVDRSASGLLSLALIALLVLVAATAASRRPRHMILQYLRSNR